MVGQFLSTAGLAMDVWEGEGENREGAAVIAFDQNH